ncbi:hypothetical protein AVEN_59082-1 [Araneus ventricosus]|uniref:Uncharacterized protein n=1 Tax=Araneus ventricosus TaxID=182803 RepID=A0A4Y2KSZ3_ARAVE|nr:hypothetical protein AVEN_59082-1 [Araneus ventricosus]
MPPLESSSSDTLNYPFLSFPPPPVYDLKPRPRAFHHKYLYRKREAIPNTQLYQSDTLYHVDTVYQPTEKERDGGYYFSLSFASDN